LTEFEQDLDRIWTDLGRIWTDLDRIWTDLDRIWIGFIGQDLDRIRTGFGQDLDRIWIRIWTRIWTEFRKDLVKDLDKDWQNLDRIWTETNDVMHNFFKIFLLPIEL